jgi:RNA polymerase-binding transcription factor DksA
MAKKKDNKKAVKKTKPASKSAKKSASKPSASSAKSKPAKKINKPASKPAKSVGSKAAKPGKPVKPLAKKVDKKMTKPVAKKELKKKEIPKSSGTKKSTQESGVKKGSKEIPKAAKKPIGKPIDAIAVKGKKGTGKVVPGKKGKKGDVEDAGGEDEEDVEVKDDYEKPEDEDAVIDPSLDDAGMIDLEGVSAPEIDEDEDEIPEKRGRGRRKKNEGKSSGGSMEAYIRNRPLQIDINKPLIKKGNTPAPKPFLNTEDKRTRYSDKELAEFKELILEKLKEAQADYDLLKQTLSNEDNHGTDDTSPSFKLLEDGSDVMSKEETAQLASRQEKYIVNLKNALVRIENKAYGICRVTGKLMPKERLRSVPHATLGIDAKLSQS